MAKKAVLLLNLGSPDASTLAAVKKYLGEFLMDPRVVNLPWVLRWILVKLIIVPFRSKNTLAAYQSIWLQPTQAAPLIQHTKALSDALASRLSQNSPEHEYATFYAMRYGKPGIQETLEKILTDDIEELFVLPQYPHQADSTRTTSIERVNSVLKKLSARQVPKYLPPFYKEPDYIAALEQVCREHLPKNFDHLLFSYHGLPEQHIKDADPTGRHCLSGDCCNIQSEAHAACYRHQVYASSHLLANSLGLSQTEYSVSFQSRLGRQQWLTPYTDQVLAELPARGSKNIAVICPAFTADNLETLEEMDIRGREIFIQAGGSELTLIPCLNQNSKYVDFMEAWVRNG